MFPSSYYRSPVTAPALNPREKYLAALAEAKAAEAEYLAAEKLQQEEEALRQRLDQIQHLKQQQQQQQQPAPNPYYTPAQAHFAQPSPPFPQYAPAPAAVDLDALRRQIAAEERARILQEQQQQVRREEALRLDEARRAQEGRDAERARNLAAQNARLATLTQRALRPAVRYVVPEGESVRGDWEHCRPPPELRNRVNVTPYMIAEAAKKQGPSASCPCAPASAPKPKAKPEVKETNDLEALFGQLFGGQQPKARPQPKKAPAPAPAPAPKVVSLDELIHHVLGASQPQPQPKAEAKPQQQQQPAKEAPQTINLEQLLQHVLGGAVAQRQPEATPKAPQEPAKEQAPAPTLEQIINHFLGAVAKPEASPSASGSTSEPAKTEQPAAVPAPTPAPAQPQSAPAPAPATQAPHHAGVDFLNQLLGGASARHSGSDSTPTPLNLQNLLNMYLDHAHPSAPSAPEAGPSNSAPAPARAPSHKEQEERELAEAIRMSLAEAEAHPAAAADKGKAPAPAPEKDIASSTAEVRAIDAQYTLLANEFVFPAQLDFTTSRSASPTRNGGAGSEESPVARLLSYGAANQPVRYYHQALTGLLARLDAVESFGDEGLRGMRKEVVGRVEGAMDEVERGVEVRWRKVVGKVERVAAELAPAAEVAPQPGAAAPESTPEPEAVEVVAEEAVVDESVVVEAEVPEPETAATSTPAPIAESEPSPAAEPELSSSYPPASESTSSIPTVVSSPPYPAPPAPSLADDTAAAPSPPVELDVVDESLETLRPPTPTPPSPAPSSPSDLDTFLLPADAALADEKKTRKAEDEHEVGSDWSEVDAL
ncbi:hypothetical protein C8R47DRAFT_232726 [Mycena vitilis]|nr:hypothetical protein C8R47DRAFT_232726 [Mycena vitilis]